MLSVLAGGAPTDAKLEFSVFYPATVRRALKLKLFLELLYASFSDTPPWDRALIERRMLSERVID